MASGPEPLLAVNVIGYEPTAAADGEPLSTPEAGSKTTPAGRAPASVKLAAGNPDALTVKALLDPVANAVCEELVIAGF